MERIKGIKEELRILRKKGEEQERQFKKIKKKMLKAFNSLKEGQKKNCSFSWEKEINCCRNICEREGLEVVDIVMEKIPPDERIEIEGFEEVNVKGSFIIAVLFADKKGESRLVAIFFPTSSRIYDHLVRSKKLVKIKEIKFFLALNVGDSFKISGGPFNVAVTLEGKDENDIVKEEEVEFSYLGSRFFF